MTRFLVTWGKWQQFLPLLFISGAFLSGGNSMPKVKLPLSFQGIWQHAGAACHIRPGSALLCFAPVRLATASNRHDYSYKYMIYIIICIQGWAQIKRKGCRKGYPTNMQKHNYKSTYMCPYICLSRSVYMYIYIYTGA